MVLLRVLCILSAFFWGHASSQSSECSNFACNVDEDCGIPFLFCYQEGNNITTAADVATNCTGICAPCFAGTCTDDFSCPPNQVCENMGEFCAGTCVSFEDPTEPVCNYFPFEMNSTTTDSTFQILGLSCDENDDCFISEQCVGGGGSDSTDCLGLCTPCDGRSCSFVQDCGILQECTNDFGGIFDDFFHCGGICENPLDPNGVVCEKVLDGLLTTFTCNLDTDCPFDQKCTGGEGNRLGGCLGTCNYCGGISCSSDLDCGASQICQNEGANCGGVCFNPTDPDAVICEKRVSLFPFPTLTCNAGEDCSTDEFCSHSSGGEANSTSCDGDCLFCDFPSCSSSFQCGLEAKCLDSGPHCVGVCVDACPFDVETSIGSCDVSEDCFPFFQCSGGGNATSNECSGQCVTCDQGACGNDFDCPFNQICQDASDFCSGTCINPDDPDAEVCGFINAAEGFQTRFITCNTDADCDVIDSCAGGSVTGCTGLCFPCDAGRCTLDFSCPGAQQCEDPGFHCAGTCKDLSGSSGCDFVNVSPANRTLSCNANEGCFFSDECVGGGGASSTSCSGICESCSNNTCSFDDDCGTGERCEGIGSHCSGICVTSCAVDFNSGYRQCNHDAECNDFSRCVGGDGATSTNCTGICLPCDNGTCTDSFSCPLDQLCADAGANCAGTCFQPNGDEFCNIVFNGEELVLECNTNDDCSSFLECVGGGGSNSTACSGECKLCQTNSCSSVEDCPDFSYFCKGEGPHCAGICSESTSNCTDLNFCNSDEECADELICTGTDFDVSCSGNCTECEGTSCSNDSNCATGQLCSGARPHCGGTCEPEAIFSTERSGLRNGNRIRT